VDGDVERITAQVVHSAAQTGDAVAVDLFRKAGMYLGIGIASLMYLLNPGMVVVGGSVAEAGDLLLVPMRATIRQRIHEIYWHDCPIVQAQLGKDVGLIGAGILLMEACARQRERTAQCQGNSLSRG
jgi:glucokinase